jgi:universal stress protein A
MFAPKKILVPTDFSAYADNALKEAIDIAKQNKAKIYLFHVIDDGFQQCAVDYCIDEATVQKITNDSLVNAKEKLKKEIKKITDDHGDIDIAYEAQRGIPYEEIVKKQKELGIDLIVIASHGRTGILKNLMGGVVEKVMKNASCPILLVKN